jgi:acetyl esterase
MKALSLILVLIVCCSCGGGSGGGGGETPAAVAPAASPAPPPPAFVAQEYTYKQASGMDLKLYALLPNNGQKNRPAIIFFYGGNWSWRNLSCFNDYARYFTSDRGLVTFKADYRVASDAQGIYPLDSTRDGQDAYKWVKAHAEELGVDPTRIVAAGASSGSQIAYYTGANLLVLLDEAIDLRQSPLMLGNLSDAVAISPLVTVETDTPLAPIFLHVGDRDYAGRLAWAYEFQNKVKVRNSYIEMWVGAGAEHGTSIIEPWETALIEKMDRFLVRFGYLSGEPKVDGQEDAIYRVE